jgi:hypothetical protein
MKLVTWKTVLSRENRPDEFFFSFGKLSMDEFGKPFFLFSCSEKDAREAFGDEIDKLTGIAKVHPVTLTLSIGHKIDGQ